MYHGYGRFSQYSGAPWHGRGVKGQGKGTEVNGKGRRQRKNESDGDFGRSLDDFALCCEPHCPGHIPKRTLERKPTMACWECGRTFIPVEPNVSQSVNAAPLGAQKRAL